MGFLDKALTGMGTAAASAGEGFLAAGNYVWGSAGECILKYIAIDPTAASSPIAGWSVVVDIYAFMQGIAVSLVSLFFVAGWCKETIDIRQNFNLENNFKFFIRFILSVGLVGNGLDIIRELLGLGAALAVRVGAVTFTSMTTFAGGSFTSSIENISDGSQVLVMGLIYMIGGLLGAAVTFVCAIRILIAVLGRFYRIFVIVPFAPVAFSTFAGGHELSHTGSAWIKTFFGYLLEVVVIAISLQLCNKMFGNTTFFGSEIANDDAWIALVAKSILVVVECVMPVLLTSTCVTTAESVIRKCLGLNT